MKFILLKYVIKIKEKLYLDLLHQLHKFMLDAVHIAI